MENTNKSNAFFRYLEKIRKDRHISQEDFAFGIVSLRQYRRYLNAESTVSHDILQELCKRLNLKLEYALLEFEADRLTETQKINELYNYIVNYDFLNASSLLKEIESTIILDRDNNILLKHSKNLLSFFKRQMTEAQIIRETESLININQLLGMNVFTNTELLVLISLFQFNDYKKLALISNKLTGYINKEIKIITGHNIRTIILVLQQLSKYYGTIKDFDNSLICATLGIDYSNKMRSFYLLDYLYFYKAMIHYNNNETEALEEALYRCYNVLDLEGNPSKTEKMKELIENALNINLENFVKNYIQHKKILI